MNSVPFPDFALPLLAARPVLQAGNDDPMCATDPDDWWEWEFETGLPFSYTLTNCKQKDGQQRWYVTGHLGDSEVASLKAMLVRFCDLAAPVLEENPEMILPAPWRDLLVEHGLLKVETLTHEHYHFT